MVNTILFVDRDPDICAMVGEIRDSTPQLDIRIVKTLKEAHQDLAARKIDGLIVDGMFFVKDLLEFLRQVRAAHPDLAITVLAVGVDMILETEFIDAMKARKVKVLPKNEVFSGADKIRALFESCMGGADKI